MLDKTEAKTGAFRLEEATIDELHRAIKDGRTTCVAVVRHYIDRVRAFNGVASALAGGVDGGGVAEVRGEIREHGVEDGGIDGSGGVVIEIDTHERAT